MLRLEEDTTGINRRLRGEGLDVLANITMPNANVYYEIGARHAAPETGCVLIAAEGSRAPFDIDQMRAVRYPLDPTGLTDTGAAQIREAHGDAMLDRVTDRQVKATGAALLATLLTMPAMSQSAAELKLDDLIALMARARSEGQTGIARKTKLVDARPAHIGEIIVTAIKGEGKETQSPPAQKGDWVVRNRCPETGNEQYLVTAARFADRYRMTGTKMSAHGWREYRPVGKEVRFLILTRDTQPFTFIAPWGESMVARPADVIVQDPKNEKDVYRVAAASFACTYEIVSAAPTRP